jgi:hypothetical protein
LASAERCRPDPQRHGREPGIFSGPSSLGFLPVVIPAADLLEDAKQAMEGKKPSGAE